MKKTFQTSFFFWRVCALAYAFICVFIMFQAIFPQLGNCASSDYVLEDFQEHGMVFNKEAQKYIDDLTAKVLQKERTAGYFGGDRQENVIREKVKQAYAYGCGVTERLPDRSDDKEHKACRATNDYLQKWCVERPEIENKEKVKSLARDNYERARKKTELVIRGNELMRQEKLEKNRQDTERLLEQQAKWQDSLFKAQKEQNERLANEEKERMCEKKCRAIYGERVAFYDCFELCKQHIAPVPESPRRP